ncbi:MAG TPA: response regulator [Petrotogaceae bacterium]|nr:response regulator [Petrotogaceae bacterium]HNV04504.1 response regulator [Petrotogaceae bacterium]
MEFYEELNEVIIIEDSDSVINLYIRLLSNFMNRKVMPRVIKTFQEVNTILSESSKLLRERVSLIIAEAEIEDREVLDQLSMIKKTLPKTKVYVISNKVNIERLKKALKSDLSDWIEKPITPDEFYEIVNMSLFRGQTYDSKARELDNEIKEFDPDNDLKYYTLENMISKLILENPSRFEGHYLLGKLYERRGIKTLAQKHYDAAQALKD